LSLQPCKAVAKLLRELSVGNPDNGKNGNDAPDEPSTIRGCAAPAETALSMRSAVSTTLQRLTTTRRHTSYPPSPPLSTSHLQHKHSQPCTQASRPFPTLVAQTANENLLLDALRTKEQLAETLQRRVLELQAANVLNEMYCSMLRVSLHIMKRKKTHQKGWEAGWRRTAKTSLR